MPKAINDPLLLIGKIFCIFIQGAMALGAVALVIGDRAPGRVLGPEVDCAANVLSATNGVTGRMNAL